MAQRRVCDAISNLEGIEKVSITKNMIQASRNAHALYNQNIKEKQKTLDEQSANKLKGKKTTVMLKNLEEKKRKVM